MQYLMEINTDTDTEPKILAQAETVTHLWQAFFERQIQLKREGFEEISFDPEPPCMEFKPTLALFICAEPVYRKGLQ